MKAFIVTNNVSVKEKYAAEDILFFDVSYGEILVKVRDMCHKGHKLLTHPLSGSVKPNETPFKSIMVAKEISKPDYEESIRLIELAVQTYNKFPKLDIIWNEQILDDFRTVDLELIDGAVASMLRK